MAAKFFPPNGSFAWRITFILIAGLAAAFAVVPLRAQMQGPMAPAPGTAKPPSESQPKPDASAPKAKPPGQTAAQPESLGPPPIPVEEIIQKFAAKETEFKAERENYTYTQTFVVQTLDDTNQVDGEYRLVSDIVFAPNGKRYEKVTYAPQPTLEKVILTQEDFNDLVHLYPFVLTTEDLPKYDIKYVDHEPLDELTTYVFDVTPKTVEKNQRYVQGRIWVDDKDFQIVKTYGKPVGYAKKSKHGDEQFFPHFETFRENIDRKYWFPTYTRADEIFHLKEGDIHLRIVVRFENYKRFGVTVKIGKPTETTEPENEKK